MTWQFRIRDGERVYNHGYYGGDMKAAADSYRARVAMYMSDGTREIPNPIAAEKPDESIEPANNKDAAAVREHSCEETSATSIARSDGYTSVIAALENGRKKPKQPRKVKTKSQNIKKGGEDI